VARVKKKAAKKKRVTQDEFVARLLPNQRRAYLRHVGRGDIRGATIDEETEALELHMRSGRDVVVRAPKYEAPVFRRWVLIAAVVAGVWADWSGTLPLPLHGNAAAAWLLWTIPVGVFVGFMSEWPTRRPRKQAFLHAITVGAAAFGMRELFEEAKHGGKHDRTKNTTQ